MSGLLNRKGLRFLFRTEEGEIGARAWWSGAVILTCILAPLTLGWLALQPYAYRKLDERAFLDPMTIVAYVYVLALALVIMLCAVSYTNLSAKRFRARGWRANPAMLAALLPLLALFAGAAHWLYPRVADVTPWALVVLCDFALACVAIWHIIDLGLLRDNLRRQDQ
ncbi:MAG: hypothetical protein FJX29_10515 [Alphaproteobacteria bacterium]|nr:hypothetical protein [Alphaproteobacteria bacterium]